MTAIDVMEAASAVPRHYHFPSEVVTFYRFMETSMPDVAVHCRRVAHLCEKFATFCNLSETDGLLLSSAAFLHDIGKMFVPRDVLYKSGKLSDEDMSAVRQHALFGDSVLRSHLSLDRVATIVGQHHERVDGGGYPYGLRRNKIDPLTHMLSVVDAYAAMIEWRVYSASKSRSEARYELQWAAGTQLDEQRVEQFLAFDASATEAL